MRERIHNIANLLDLAELTENQLLERCLSTTGEPPTVDELARIANTIGRLATLRKTLSQLDASDDPSPTDPRKPARRPSTETHEPNALSDQPVAPGAPRPTTKTASLTRQMPPR